ncbi:MAG TPA: phage portal protein [Gammaproteobacteria bacterium]
MFGWFKRKPETRSSGAGYTAEIMAARESYLSGVSGIGELTATVQSCITLWEGAFALADVQGTEMLDRKAMALIARSAALRGEAVMLITDAGLLPVADWDLSTRDGVPRAYRLSVSEAGGARPYTALAAEVLHLRIGSDMVTPWAGQAPLRRASLTAGLLQAVEVALAEVYGNASLGSMIVPYPETSPEEKERLGRTFRGVRGRVLVRESVTVSAAGGPAPQQDWKPNDLTPDLSRAMTRETLEAAREAICGVYGILPGLMNKATTGPMVREAQRHLAGWVLQPIAELLAEEASAKLGADVMIDVGRPLQAFDAGGRARALAQIIEAMGRAKELGLTPDQMQSALLSVNFGGGDNLA